MYMVCTEKQACDFFAGLFVAYMYMLQEHTVQMDDDVKVLLSFCDLLVTVL